jgi:hypothetical protein
MLKEMQEVKVGGRTQRVQVRPFAWGLQGPSSTPWPHAYASPLMAKKCSSAHPKVGQSGK